MCVRDSRSVRYASSTHLTRGPDRATSRRTVENCLSQSDRADEESVFRETLKYGNFIVESHPELVVSVSLKGIAAKLMNLEYSSPVGMPLFARFGLL